MNLASSQQPSGSDVGICFTSRRLDTLTNIVLEGKHKQVFRLLLVCSSNCFSPPKAVVAAFVFNLYRNRKFHKRRGLNSMQNRETPKKQKSQKNLAKIDKNTSASSHPLHFFQAEHFVETHRIL